MKLRVWCILVPILCLSCVGPRKSPQAEEGYLSVVGGRIWYKIIGSGEGIPLLVIHGGPGDRSCEHLAYLAPLAKSRPVVFYDQLGSGRSDCPSDKALWNMPRFVDEVSRLREALGLHELHILGHSWGGAVAIEYVLSQAPRGVRSLTLAGPLIDTEQWIEDTSVLRTLLPEDIQAVLKAGEESQDYSSPEYLAATDYFYTKFLARSGWPLAAVPECDGSRDFNTEIYEYMWGPTEFTATGTLRDFNRTDDLHEIKVPVMFLVGRYDEARPETMFKYQRLTQGSVVEIIEDAGHMSMVDQPERFNAVVEEFLDSVEARNAVSEYTITSESNGTSLSVGP